MTWVIGASALESTYLVSDVQISVTSDGRTDYYDCLQKIHPLGRFIIGGFSGSVQIGFKVVDRLRKKFDCAPNQACCLDIASKSWVREIIKTEFEDHDEDIKGLGFSIILTGRNLKESKGKSRPQPYSTFIFRAPNFEPIEVPFRKAAQIGCGADNSINVDKINAQISSFTFLEMEVGMPLGPGLSLVHSIFEALKESPVPGVSRMFQVGMVSGNTVTVFSPQCQQYDNEGNMQEHRLPTLVTTMDGLDAYLKREGKGLAAAVC